MTSKHTRRGAAFLCALALIAAACGGDDDDDGTDTTVALRDDHRSGGDLGSARHGGYRRDLGDRRDHRPG